MGSFKLHRKRCDMTPLQIIWTMIKDLLTVDYTYYNANNIINAYQNNFTLPQIDDFIILQQRNVFQNGLPLRGYDVDTQKKILTGFNDYEYQVDLYGNNSSISASILYTYLNSSAASNYLLDYQMGIGKLYEGRNLTKPNDRDRYMQRYMLLFTAMGIQDVRVPIPGVGVGDVDITYEELL